jgi:hypothetical protein
MGVSDIDGNILSVEAERSEFVYDDYRDVVCFTPDTSGTYLIRAIVVDECEVADTAVMAVDVREGTTTTIDCPIVKPDTLGEPGEVCFALTVAGFDGNVTTSFGTYHGGEVCFFADTSGTYTITIISDADCNSDTCEVTVPVTILEPVMVSCPDVVVDVFHCTKPGTLTFNIEIEGDVEVLRVWPEAAFIVNDTLYYEVSEPGEYQFGIYVENAFTSDSCEFTATVNFNDPPVITWPNPFLADPDREADRRSEPIASNSSEQSGFLQEIEYVVCSLTEICVPFTITDEDNNIVSIVGPDYGTTSETGFCFTPSDTGGYEIDIAVTDDCDATDYATAFVRILYGDSAFIDCPEVAFVSICEPQQKCFPVEISPIDAIVTILPASYEGVYANGEVCVNLAQGGAHDITVIAEAQCSSDTCEFTINVDMQEEPILTCPGEINETLCLEEHQTLCFDVTLVQGTGVDIFVKPVGNYSAGQVCVPIDTAGVYELEIIAEGVCGFDTCLTTLNITADAEPTISVTEFASFERCPEDDQPICIPGVVLEMLDLESDPTVSMVCGIGDFNAETNELCFLPDTMGLYTFCFEAFDGCHVVADTLEVEIVAAEDCDVCVRFSIEGGPCSPVGLRTTVAVNIDTRVEIGGIDLLMAYDASAAPRKTGNISRTGSTPDHAEAVARRD